MSTESRSPAYEAEQVVGTLTLDVRQAKLLSLLLSDDVEHMPVGGSIGEVLPIEGIEREALQDVKRRIDVLCGFEDIIRAKETLDPDTPCASCGVELRKHFPLPPVGCDGFARGDA